MSSPRQPDLDAEPLRALREQEEDFAAVLEASPEAIGVVNLESGLFEKLNARAEQMFGLSRAELERRGPLDVSPELQPDGRPSREVAAEWIDAAMRGELAVFEWVHARADGETFFAEIRLVRLPSPRAHLMRFSATDISARKRAEAEVQRLTESLEALVAARTRELEASEARLRASTEVMLRLIESVPVRVFWKDRQSRFLGCNTLFARDAGEERPDQIVGKTDDALGWREQAELYRADDRAVMESGVAKLAYEEPQTTPEGRRIWLRTSKAPLFGPDRAVVGVVGTYEDITEQKRAENALAESEAKFRALTEESLVGVYVIQDDRFRYVNPTHARTLGYSREEMLALPSVNATIAPEDHARAGDAMARLLAGRPMTAPLEIQVRAKDGTTKVLAVMAGVATFEGRPGVIGSAIDVTEARRLERRMQRAQRLEAIGTLAGGVAHDLNNALSPIMMGLEVLRAEYPNESAIVETFHASVQRSAEMVRQLLTFAKGASGERVALAPQRLLREVERLASASFPKDVEIVVRDALDAPTVLGDATQLHQVLLNLCVNARDAMPHGGRLLLSAEDADVDAAFAATVVDAQPGRYAILRVEDTGCGIPPELLDRIFDPFFTTKPADKGTGLGLSSVLGIVKGHAGFVQVRSEVGRGSTFSVYLPASDVRESALPSATAQRSDFRGNGQLVLLIDDEPAVRLTGDAVLRRLGCAPLTAPDGAAGLACLEARADELQAVITDVHMPRLDGLAFIRAARAVAPTLPIVVATGRLDRELTEELGALGVTVHLAKPFSESQLAEALQRVLRR